MDIVEIPRGRGRPRAFERSVVLDRAMEVFWARGYEGASIPELTKAMGISAQSLYAAFGSKEALYRESLEVYRSTIGGFAAKALEEEPEIIEALTRLFRDAAKTFVRTAGTPGCMITMAPGGSVEPELAALGLGLRKESADKVAHRLTRGIRENQLRLDLDVHAWSNYINSVIQGMSVQARDGATQAELFSLAEIAIRSLYLLCIK